MTRHRLLSFATCFVLAAVVVSCVASASAQFQRDKRWPVPDRQKIAAPQETSFVTLTNGTGDRSLSLTVDGYGSFGSNSGAGEAIFDPAGPIGPSSTVYDSGIYFSPVEGFLATGGLGGRPAIGFTSSDSSTATSTFDAGGFRVVLTQMVRRTENGSTLEQTYQIQNLMSSTRSFNVVRFVDGDLRFDESISDFGAASEDGRTLSEFDMGDDPQAASTYVGITDSGGTPDGFTIQEYPYAEFIFEFGGIPPGDNGLIAGDNNGDRVTDFGYDVTLALESFFTTGGGQTVTYTSITRFGDQTLVPRATLMWDPPDPASTLAEPPPQHLQAIPIASGSALPAAAPLEPRADVLRYNVYSSSTTPVVPSADTYFMSVPATQTTSPVPTGAGGSFFVVTATYESGESAASNEASADVPAATLTSVKVTSVKIVGKGAGFTGTVSVFIDGIPFTTAAKVKGTFKVTQKGTLITGQSARDYIASRGGTALIQFRNSNGGIVSRLYTQ
ncbi:MAG: hypothetical protein IPF53_14855 [Blastocatellia bacterium]|jgi:hypothetical protein|nr:hypothetical protein [Blastocatellia bacterium]